MLSELTGFKVERRFTETHAVTDVALSFDHLKAHLEDYTYRYILEFTPNGVTIDRYREGDDE